MCKHNGYVYVLEGFTVCRRNMLCNDNNNKDILFSFSLITFCSHGDPTLATPEQFPHYITTTFNYCEV